MISPVESKLSKDISSFKVDVSYTIASIVNKYSLADPECVFSSFQKPHELDTCMEISVRSSTDKKCIEILEDSISNAYSDILSILDSVERLSLE